MPERQRGGQRRRKGARKRRGAVGAVAFGIAFFLLAVAVSTGLIVISHQVRKNADRFAEGIRIGQTPLGGLTYAEAENLLERAALQAMEEFSVTLEWQGTQYVLNAADLRMQAETSSMLAPLFAIGKKGNFLECYLELRKTAREGVSAVPEITLDEAPVEDLLAMIRADIEQEPVDATATFLPGDAEPFRYTQEIEGRSVSLDGVREQILDSARRLESVVIPVRDRTVSPAVTRADLEANTLLRGRLTFPLGQGAGAENAAMAIRALDGRTLASGESLSFVQACGLSSGQVPYVVAEEPAYGEGVSGVGGGICRAASAVYRLALENGLTVTQRHPAAQPQTGIPAGEEAAVSSQGLDLVVENSTGYPLYLMCRTYEAAGELQAELLLIGAPLHAAYSLGSTSTVLPAPEEPVYILDREGRYATYQDEHVPVSEARDGLEAVVQLVETGEDGQERSRTEISRDRYEPAPQRIYVGSQTRST